MPRKIPHEVVKCKLTNIEKGWLAGIIDGEGHIGVHKCSDKAKYHVRKFTVTNTNLGIVNECSRILHKINVFHKVYAVPDNRQRINGYKQAYVVRIDRVGEMVYVLNIIYPYIKSTEKQLSILKMFDDIEQSKRSDGRRLNTIKRKETPTQLHLASVG